MFLMMFSGMTVTQKSYPKPASVIGVLESLIGVALATKVHNLPWLFDFLQPMLQQVSSDFNHKPWV